MKKIFLISFLILFPLFLFAKEKKSSVTLAGLLLKAKETKNITLKKELLRESFKIKPTLYAVKMLLSLNKNNLQKQLEIIKYAYDLFPLNKFLTLKAIDICFKTSSLKEAKFFIFNYLKTYPLDKDVLFRLALLFKKEGDNIAALRVYKTIAKLYNDKKALEKIKEIDVIFN